MSTNIRFPNITAATPAEQINQIKSYLHQLVQQLNWALSNLETSPAIGSGERPSSTGITEESFNELKSLITQSTSMLDSFYKKINIKLEGQYVSQANFDAHTRRVDERFEQLGGPFVSQADFVAHTQEVSQRFNGLGEQFVSKTDLEAYKQEMVGIFAGLDCKYILKTDYDDLLANNEIIKDLQQRLEALEQTDDENKETGGEPDGNQ